MALPGGCDIGSRPIDLHVKGFKSLGAEVDLSYGLISVNAKRLIGKHIYTAEDTGGKVDGDHIDIFFDTHEEVEEFANRKGIKYVNVWVVR